MEKIAKTHRQRCQEECTRDVVFLFQYSFWRKSGPVPCDHWITEGVWIDREEAEAYGKAHHYNYRHWRVFGVPSNGRLAELLKAQDAAEMAVK